MFGPCPDHHPLPPTRDPNRPLPPTRNPSRLAMAAPAVRQPRASARQPPAPCHARGSQPRACPASPRRCCVLPSARPWQARLAPSSGVAKPQVPCPAMGAHKNTAPPDLPWAKGGRRPWFCFAFYTQMSANRKDNTTDGIVGLFNAVLGVLLAFFFIIYESRIRVVSTYLNRVRPVKPSGSRWRFQK